MSSLEHRCIIMKGLVASGKRFQDTDCLEHSVRSFYLLPECLYHCQPK